MDFFWNLIKIWIKLTKTQTLHWIGLGGRIVASFSRAQSLHVKPYRSSLDPCPFFSKCFQQLSIAFTNLNNWYGYIHFTTFSISNTVLIIQPPFQTPTSSKFFHLENFNMKMVCHFLEIILILSRFSKYSIWTQSKKKFSIIYFFYSFNLIKI